MFNPYIRRSPNWIGICRQYQIQYSIKDNENLATHNIWSGGDYLNNTTGLWVINGVSEASSEYQYNGDKSFKMTTITAPLQMNVIKIDYFHVGESLTASLNYNIPTGSAHLVFIQLDSENNILFQQQVGVGSNTNGFC